MMTGPKAEISAALNVMHSMFEMRELMLADINSASDLGSDEIEELADIDKAIREAAKKGDAARRELIKKGNVTQDESSAVLGFMRSKREILAKLEE